MHTALEDGTRLAAAGILWKVYDETYEVVFTGSLGWKNKCGRRGNTRSHHIQLPGPHYVFVRDAALAGREVKWSHLRKFIVQVFFNNGTPEEKLPKSVVVVTGLLANEFLRQVVDPRKWYDVELAGPPVQLKTVAGTTQTFQTNF